jgi:glyoxylase-like metal-dependent hydrolase (beta-lactamase superfamily II)
MGVEFPDLPRSGRLALRLEAAGIDLASVTDVVLTHMHMDHVGGLLADKVKSRLRPDLRVHLAAAEAEFWASPDFSRVSMPPVDLRWPVATAERPTPPGPRRSTTRRPAR